MTANPVNAVADNSHRERDALARIDSLATELLRATHELADARDTIEGLRADCDQAHRLIERLTADNKRLAAEHDPQHDATPDARHFTTAEES